MNDAERRGKGTVFYNRSQSGVFNRDDFIIEVMRRGTGAQKYRKIVVPVSTSVFLNEYPSSSPLGDVIAVLARVGKTLAIVDMPVAAEGGVGASPADKTPYRYQTTYKNELKMGSH
jgi:hypothetical protein